MDVLALYDIHGNVAALDAVLADPRAGDPDAVLVGGDAVPGPFAAATLDRLSTPERWEAALAGVADGLVVAGNTDEQDDRAVRGVRFVNAGSVGLPYEATARRAGCGSPTAIRPAPAAYDAAAAGARILEAGWPERSSAARSPTRRAARGDPDLRGPGPLRLTRRAVRSPACSRVGVRGRPRGSSCSPGCCSSAATIAGYLRLAIVDSDSSRTARPPR